MSDVGLLLVLDPEPMSDLTKLEIPDDPDVDDESRLPPRLIPARISPGWSEAEFNPPPPTRLWKICDACSQARFFTMLKMLSRLGGLKKMSRPPDVIKLSRHVVDANEPGRFEKFCVAMSACASM
jgi:hypothetical protein